MRVQGTKQQPLGRLVRSQMRKNGSADVIVESLGGRHTKIMIPIAMGDHSGYMWLFLPLQFFLSRS